jgi:hypothetical protein
VRPLKGSHERVGITEAPVTIFLSIFKFTGEVEVLGGVTVTVTVDVLKKGNDDIFESCAGLVWDLWVESLPGEVCIAAH